METVAPHAGAWIETSGCDVTVTVMELGER